MSGRIDWGGTDRIVIQNMQRYERRVYEAIRYVADYFAPVLENYAKANAPWVDRTGNARASLHAFKRELSEAVVELYLAHGMDYGIHLERRFQGRYAIILPTLQAHYPQVGQMLREIFS